MLFLRDLVTPDYREARPTSYYRINGLNRINVNIFCEQKSNMIDLSLKTRTEMKRMAEGLPDNYSLTMVLDNSQELKDELKDNMVRTGLTILILLLFVWITSRSLRYLPGSKYTDSSGAVLFFRYRDSSVFPCRDNSVVRYHYRQCDCDDRPLSASS